MSPLRRIALIALPWLIVIAIWYAIAWSGLVNPSLVPTPHHVAARFWELLTTARLPLDIAMSTQRVLIGVAWATLVASELIAAQQGLGALIQNASSFFQLDIIYVGIICIGLIALAMDVVLRTVARRLVAWQERIA
jgi:NitT/TauT family transport system permease protein